MEKKGVKLLFFQRWEIWRQARLPHSSRFRNLPFPLRCFAVDQLFPREQIEPRQELLVTVVNDAGVDSEGPRDFR